MQVKVLYFAAVRELAGCGEELVTLEERASIARALEVIVEKHPSIAAHLPQLRYARNEAFARSDELLEPGDVIALIPPVAGG